MSCDRKTKRSLRCGQTGGRYNERHANFAEARRQKGAFAAMTFAAVIPSQEDTARRAQECAEQLLSDYRRDLTPETYERCRRFGTVAARDLHPFAVQAMFRLHRRITGDRT